MEAFTNKAAFEKLIVMGALSLLAIVTAPVILVWVIATIPSRLLKVVVDFLIGLFRKLLSTVVEVKADE